MSNTRQLSFIVSFCLVAFVAQSVHAQKMYWTNTFAGKIQRANLDGTQVEDLFFDDSARPSFGIALDLPTGKMYWTDSDASHISRANLDGGQVEILLTAEEGAIGPNSIALDLGAGKMYWVNFAGRVLRANLDGSEIELLISSGLVRPIGLALDLENDMMYITDRGFVTSIATNGSILRANLDGSALVTLISNLRIPIDIALDMGAGLMYWTDIKTESISRSMLDGSDILEVVTIGISSPSGIVLDMTAAKIYWTDKTNDKIQRANFDGSMVEDLVTGLSRPRDIALDLGACLTDVACSDGNNCTDDVCTNGVCSFHANTNSCDDENACTDDICSGGICVGTPNNNACDDGDVCTDDVCSGGVCVGTLNSNICDDGNQCTSNDVCTDGECLGQNHTGPCDDGSICTTATVCADGVCQGGTSVPDVCFTYSLLVSEVNGTPCPSCPTANLPKEEVLPGDQITIEAFISDWGGANNARLLSAFQWSLDLSMLTNNGIGLALASISCETDSDCHHGFTSASQCTCLDAQCSVDGFCDARATAFFDKTRPDFDFSNDINAVAIATTFVEFAAVAFDLNSGQFTYKVDQGALRYAGTLLLDASILARGTFVVSMLDDLERTFASDEFAITIPAGTLNSVTINFCDVIDSPNDCNGNSIPDECEPDGDGDGVIDACDPCPLDLADDSDGDGVCDSDDGCPTNPLKIVPGACGCSNPEDDTDGDGVPDCVDLCSGVDDTIFGAQCAGAIPTVSTWGLAILTLLLMVGGKLYFRCRSVAGYVRKPAC